MGREGGVKVLGSKEERVQNVNRYSFAVIYKLPCETVRWTFDPVGTSTSLLKSDREMLGPKPLHSHLLAQKGPVGRFQGPIQIITRITCRPPSLTVRPVYNSLG